MVHPMALLERQSIGTDIENAKNSFSSWDSCMANSVCKYPVIVAIIVVSLIVLSIVICVARCCCCGLECCCGICGCFNACCPSPRRRGDRSASKYGEGPMGYPAYSGYPNNAGYQPQPPPAYNAPAQYARFESSRPDAGGNADALPAMPTWDTATSHRVPDATHPEEGHEMASMSPHDEQVAPMLAHQAPVGGAHYPLTPTTPSVQQSYYDPISHSDPAADSFIAGAAAPSPYQQSSAQDAGHYGQPHGQQNQQYLSGNYAQAARPLPTRSESSPPRNYEPYSTYGQHQSRPSHDLGYGQTTYGVADTQAEHALSPAQSSPPQRNAFTDSPPQSNPAIPSALRSGTSPAPPARQGGYQAYGAAASAPTRQQPQYTAYTPSDVSSTRYEPSSYGGSAAGMGSQRPANGQQGWRDV